MTTEELIAKRGPYIRTWSGHRFHPLDLHPEDIRLVDIYHQQLMAPRWGGCCRIPYDSLRHSLWCARQMGDDVNIRTMAFHDCSEAYMCDMPKPFKLLLPDYTKVEKTIMDVASRAHNFVYPLNKYCAEIDALALVAERIALFDQDHWFLQEDFDYLEHLWNPAFEARDRILDICNLSDNQVIFEIDRIVQRTAPTALAA